MSIASGRCCRDCALHASTLLSVREAAWSARLSAEREVRERAVAAKAAAVFERRAP